MLPIRLRNFELCDLVHTLVQFHDGSSDAFRGSPDEGSGDQNQDQKSDGGEAGAFADFHRQV